MTYLQALILGIVEGITEFLPVSSTGHLILTNAALGLEGPAVDAYTIVIQLGAILAVLALYKDRAFQMLAGVAGKNPAGRSLFLKLLVAFVPAAIIGKLLDDPIEQLLFHPVPVAAALIVGGIAMILVERLYVLPRQQKAPESLKGVEGVSYLDALLIGVAQCLALWPGTSRSMSTIVGAQLRGLSSQAAAEVSFLLALPTLGAATLYKLIKNREDLLSMPGGIPIILFGNAVAFVVAFLAVKWFVGVVNRFGMTPFGAYRIVVGALFLWLSLSGHLTFAPQ